MRLGRATVSVAVCAVALIATSWAAAAVDAPLGAYVGCFDISYVNDIPQVKASSLSGCARACAADDKPLVMITTDSSCHCTRTIPSQLNKLNYTDCLEGGKGVAIFYQHSDAGSTLCRVSNPPFNSRAWDTNYGPENIKTNNGGLRVELTNKTGMSMQTKDTFQYGMFQVEAWITGGTGVQTTFTVRSKDDKNRSETYWRWCNGLPCDPNSIYIDSLKDGKSNGERLILAGDYQEKLDTKNTTQNDYATYTINWQPNTVGWFMNDIALEIRKAGVENMFDGVGTKPQRELFEAPNLPSYQLITMWTDPTGTFGGKVDLSKGPFYSYFKNARRIVCDQPIPTNSTQVTQLAMGPAWLYGQAETVPASQVPTLIASFEKKDAWELAPDESIPDPTNPEWVGLGSTSLGSGILPTEVKPTRSAAAAVHVAAMWQGLLGAVALLAVLLL